MNILIFGGEGFLGRRLKNYLIEKKFNPKSAGTSIKNDIVLDITKLHLFKSLEKYKFDLAINLVSLTNVEVCEKEKEACYLLNVIGARNISNYCGSNNIYLINISTDMVYSSKKYSKESDYAPINEYGFTKLKAENEFSKIKSASLRLAFMGRSKIVEKGFVDWLLSSINSENQICLWDNIFSTPISIKDTLDVILIFIKNRFEGVFNIGSSERFSKYEFALKFIEKMKLSEDKIIRIKYDNNIVRPYEMSMNSGKFINLTNWKQPDLFTTINNVAFDYLNENW
tara:strand:+ start:792 stop:1643 length:852 start_codon:yes stop_codon:yes gene_type:complete